MKFNAPPNWPLPPGWQPSTGWAPDPSWPPAPPGWQFWTEDVGPEHQAGYAWTGTEERRGSRVPWVVAGVASLVTVAALVVVLILVLHPGTRRATSGADGTRTPRGLGSTSTIQLGATPISIGLDADELYFTTDSGLLVVDPKNPASKQSFAVPTNAGSHVAIDARTHTAWVSLNDRYDSTQNRQLYVVDTQSGNIVDTLTLPYSVISVAVDPDLRRVFAINHPDNQEKVDAAGHGWVTVFDADTRREVSTVELPFPAYDMAIDTKSHNAVVVGWMGSSLFATNTLTVHDPGINLSSSSAAGAVDPRTHTGYIVSADTMYTVDLIGSTVRSEGRFPADPGPGQLAVDSAGSLIAVDDGELLVIDPVSRQISASTKLGKDWIQLAVDGSTGTIYATDPANKSVNVVERA